MGGMEPGVTPPTGGVREGVVTGVRVCKKRLVQQRAVGVVSSRRDEEHQLGADEDGRDHRDVGQVRPAGQLRVVGHQHWAKRVSENGASAAALRVSARAVAVAEPLRAGRRPVRQLERDRSLHRAHCVTRDSGEGSHESASDAGQATDSSAGIHARWTGRWGALATSPPSGPNRAQLKSRRSFMFVDTAVRLFRIRTAA